MPMRAAKKKRYLYLDNYALSILNSPQNFNASDFYIYASQLTLNFAPHRLQSQLQWLSLLYLKSIRRGQEREGSQ